VNRKKSRIERRARSKKTAGAERMDLFVHLCDVMDLFPGAGERAAGELAGKMMAERLRQERGAKRRTPAGPKPSRGR
jgi:hypothetical protein